MLKSVTQEKDGVATYLLPVYRRTFLDRNRALCNFGLSISNYHVPLLNLMKALAVREKVEEIPK